MRIRLALSVIGLCLLSSGCELITIGTRNLLFEAETSIDEWKEHHRTHQLADRAWETALQTSPILAEHSADFAKGFKDGFADYLQAGGTGQPPPVPPRHYWSSRYETAEGYQAIEDWYAGFRQGAAAAQASGLRRWMTVPSVPSALPAPGPLPPSPPLHEAVGLEFIVPEPMVPEPMVPEQMPPPRKVIPGGRTGTPPVERGVPADQNGEPPLQLPPLGPTGRAPLRLPPVGPTGPPPGPPSGGHTTTPLQTTPLPQPPPQSSASWNVAPTPALLLPGL